MARTCLLVLLSAMLMTACSSNQHADLQQYAERIKAKKGGRIEPLPEFKSYESYAYIEKDLRNPFEPTQKEAVAAEQQTGNGISPDQSRHKEALESFPLDSLIFAGNLEQRGTVWAVIKAPDGLIYKVQEGNYVGQNYGKITRISETGISITEIVPDGLGNWTERSASLTLTEE